MVGAHYDVAGNQKGADDNASAVTGLILLAGILAGEKPILPYHIEMVFYTLEEPPFFRTENIGSYIHAKSIHDEHGDDEMRLLVMDLNPLGRVPKDIATTISDWIRVGMVKSKSHEGKSKQRHRTSRRCLCGKCFYM